MNEKKREYEELVNLGLDDKFSVEDYDGRRLWLNCEVDECVIDNLVYHILRYNRLDRDLPKEKRKPVLLYINSPGGNVTDGFALIDAIRTSVTPVYTVNVGICYSMGFLIFIAGEKRYAMPHSTFLCHDGSAGAWDSTSKVKDRVAFETGQMEDKTKEYVLERTEISDGVYTAKHRVEWYMYPEEAKSYGVATDIVGVDCGIEEIA